MLARKSSNISFLLLLRLKEIEKKNEKPALKLISLMQAHRLGEARRWDGHDQYFISFHFGSTRAVELAINKHH